MRKVIAAFGAVIAGALLVPPLIVWSVIEPAAEEAGLAG